MQTGSAGRTYRGCSMERLAHAPGPLPRPNQAPEVQGHARRLGRHQPGTHAAKKGKSSHQFVFLPAALEPHLHK
eukprot:2094739-Pyramimonas_sp.AAC.1